MYILPKINSLDEYMSIPDYIMPLDFYEEQKTTLNVAKGTVTMIDASGDVECENAEFSYNGIALVFIYDGSITALQLLKFHRYSYKKLNSRVLQFGTERFFDSSSSDELIFSEEEDMDTFVAFLDQLNIYIGKFIELAIERATELFESIINSGDLKTACINMLASYPAEVFEDTIHFQAFLHELSFNDPVCNQFVGLTQEEHQQIFSIYQSDEGFLDLFRQIRDSFRSIDSYFESNFSEIHEPLTRTIVARFFLSSLTEYYASIWKKEYDATIIDTDPTNYVKDSYNRINISGMNDRAVTALSYYLIKENIIDGNFLAVKKNVKRWISEEEMGLERTAPRGLTTDQPHKAQAIVKIKDNTSRKKTTNAMMELEALIGLSSVKKDVVELSSLVKMNKIRQEKGLLTIPVSHHLVFTGNPGTGKTTVARILAKLYKEIGILSRGQLVEVDRSGLVAGYVGQTAIKTNEKIQEAMGGILFIDEAYALAKDSNDFGQEAIDTILKAMEDYRDEFIVIVAGYPDLMERFINSNPGLRSRFNKFIHFEDYEANELVQIFDAMVKKYHYSLDNEAQNRVNEMIESMVKNKDEFFANARDIRNMFERIISAQALRMANTTAATDDDFLKIIITDVQ